MAREYGRNQRVADLLQREIASLVQKEVSFRDTGLITISFVDVSPDLRNARIYFTCLKPASSGEVSAENEGLRADNDLQPDSSEEAIAQLLNEKAGHFRHLLARVLPLRVMPELVFLFDESARRTSRVSELIDSVAAGKTE